MLEQFGGPQGELAAACRYFTQYLAEDDPGRRDMLIDIATEELSHLEVIGTIVAMLNKGAKGRIAEGVDSEAEMYQYHQRRRQRLARHAGAVRRRPAADQLGRRSWTAGLRRHDRRPERPTCARTSPPRRAPRSSTSG